VSGAVVLLVSLGWRRRWCRVSPSSTGFCVCAEGRRAACEIDLFPSVFVVCSFACVTHSLTYVVTRRVCSLTRDLSRCAFVCERL